MCYYYIAIIKIKDTQIKSVSKDKISDTQLGKTSSMYWYNLHHQTLDVIKEHASNSPPIAGKVVLQIPRISQSFF